MNPTVYAVLQVLGLGLLCTLIGSPFLLGVAWLTMVPYEERRRAFKKWFRR